MISFETLTLDNGLKIISNRDPNTAMAAVNVLYDTGSRDETRDLTGVAHLFEHVMFGGSANVADYSAAIEAAGGSDNAWTSNDYTNFYEVLPAVNIETAFWLESDRMLSPTLSEEVLDVQRRVVTEEFKQQCLNRPYGDLGHHLRRLLYDSAHPYSWPVIGLEPAHIARITRDDARRWFFSHYGPDNAVLAVSGNVDHDRVFALAEKWFGDIPRRGIAPRRLPDPGFPRADVTETVTGAVPATAVVIAFPMAAYGSRPYFAADTITDILSAGRSSRLYRDLIIGGDGLFSEVDASISGSRHEGFLMLNARLTDNSDSAVARARDLMLDRARRLAVPGDVSPAELEKTFNRFESLFNFSNMGYQTKAASLAMAAMLGEDINDTVTRQRATTLADIAETAGTIFNRTPSVTVVYKPLSAV